MTQPYQPEMVETKQKSGAKLVIMPSLKEQIFDAFSRQSRARRRLAKTCGGVEAIDAVLREGIQDMQAQGALPRFRNGFGKPVQREVVAFPGRVRGAAA